MGKMKISHSDSDALERAKNTAKANKRAPINKKASLIVYVIVLVLAVAARTVQLFSNMDFDRGKYIDPSFMKNYPLLVMIPGSTRRSPTQQATVRCSWHSLWLYR